MKRIQWIVMLLGAALLTTGCSDPEAEKPGTDGAAAAQQAAEPETPDPVNVPAPAPGNDTSQSTLPTADGPAGSNVGNALFQALRKSLADNAESTAPESDETSEAPPFQR